MPATTRTKYTDIAEFHMKEGWFNPSSAYSGAAECFYKNEEYKAGSAGHNRLFLAALYFTSGWRNGSEQFGDKICI